MSHIERAAPPDSSAVAFGALARSFDQLRLCHDWHAALAEERAALAQLLDSGTTDQIAQQLVAAQGQTSKTALALLRQRWHAVMASDPGRARDLLDRMFDLMQRRVAAGGRQDAATGRGFQKTVAQLGESFPVWTAQADVAPQALPLWHNLFDMIVIDDADRVSSAVLLPLLLRTRSAVVIGFVAGSDAGRSDAMSVTRSEARSPPAAKLRATEHIRCHPEIAFYLSEVFHGGRLRILTPFGALVQGLPPAARSLLGLCWHEAPAAENSDDDPEVAGGLALIRQWHALGADNLLRFTTADHMIALDWPTFTNTC